MSKTYLRYAIKRNLTGARDYSRSFKCFVGNQLVRELIIKPENDKFIVEEYELKEDFKTGEKSMQICFCNVHNKYNYARSELIGRICSAAYENINNDHGSELANTIFGGR